MGDNVKDDGVVDVLNDKEDEEEKIQAEKEKKEQDVKEKNENEEKKINEKENKEEDKEKKEENNKCQKEGVEYKKINACDQEKVIEKENDNKKNEQEENQKKEEKEKKDIKENSNNLNTPNKPLNKEINKNTKCLSFLSFFSHFLCLLIGIMVPIGRDKLFNNDLVNNKIIEDKNKIIIGLDFGSTQSGYQIFYDSKIDFEGDEAQSIITTELIFDLYFKKGLSIGIEAKNYPKENIESEKKLYFTKFKRNLDPKNKNIMANSTIPIGGQLENDIVIKEFLILMKEHIIENVGGINYINIKDIKWILTVPPLWDENAKNKMIELAMKAEMRNVEIALEPEVASLAIFYEKNIGESLFKPQKSFLIVDMGGLTVDFTAMKILDENHNLEQLLEPVSFALGSNFINEEIINIIETAYGKEKLDKVKKTNYKLWEKTLDEIEEKKKIIGVGDSVNFNISINFNEKKCGFWRDNCKCKYNDIEIPYTSTHISIPNHLVLKIINDLGDKIINKIKQKINSKIDFDYVVITGGFSQNKILEKRLNDSLKSQIDLIFLTEPEKTVMKGAAIYGIKPNQIKQRIIPVSIGISLDDEKFLTFIKRGESVDVTTPIKSKPIEIIGNSIMFYYNYKKKEIDNENKEFLDEVKIPYIDSFEKRNVIISLKFSSYITVEVKDIEMDDVIRKILYYPHDNN